MEQFIQFNAATQATAMKVVELNALVNIWPLFGNFNDIIMF